MSNQIVQAVLNHTHEQYGLSLLRELYEEVELTGYGNDISIEFDGAEYRLISEDSIWDIYKEGIKDITLDCYLPDGELPGFVAVDWEETAQNCMVDEYGHHFSGYDGSESELNGWYVFRTN